MKLLLIALTLTLSAQTFADCSLPGKKNYINADKIICDEETNQVLLEGIKVKRFDQEKNVLINAEYNSTYVRSANGICEAFGLKRAESVELRQIFSYMSTGIELGSFYDSSIGKYVLKTVEKKQSGEIIPVKSIICNR